MISTLLLQASTTPQPTPYAVYATLAVGVLSLIASGLNIYFSSKTAQKVVNLSTKTTREVAELSAQVSRESAGLAARTAKEIKEKDYKDDYYKKIIDKRIKAIEQLEILIAPFSSAYTIKNEPKDLVVQSFFADNISKLKDENFSLFGDAYLSPLWLSLNTIKIFAKFTEIVLDTVFKVSRTEHGNDELEMYAAYYEKIGKQKQLVEKAIAMDIAKLYDVDGFIKDKYPSNE